MAWRLPFLKPRPTKGLQGLDALNAWKANGGKPSRGPRKPRAKAVLIKEMAEAIADVLLRRGKSLSREEKLQLVEDNMLDAAVAISNRLAKIREEEDFTLTDTMAMFKQVREYQMIETRRNKIDPKDKDKTKNGTPAGFVNYQAQMKDAKEKLEAPVEESERPSPAVTAVRTTAAGTIDRRHENTGRPLGQSLARQQEKIRQKQERMRAKENAVEAAETEASQGK